MQSAVYNRIVKTVSVLIFMIGAGFMLGEFQEWVGTSVSSFSSLMGLIGMIVGLLSFGLCRKPECKDD